MPLQTVADRRYDVVHRGFTGGSRARGFMGAETVCAAGSGDIGSRYPSSGRLYLARPFAAAPARP